MPAIRAQTNVANYFLPALRFLQRHILVLVAIVLSLLSIIYSYQHHWIIAYGDAESHLNIAKRVIAGLTPGFAQLGAVWLPLPHLFMVPFVWSNTLWRTGLAGSIVSAIAFIFSAILVYRIVLQLGGSRAAGVAGFLAFVLNPNILYMQTTPMTELLLIAFQLASAYFFIQYIRDFSKVKPLLLTALFAFAAALTRYDGWFFIFMELGSVALIHLFNRELRKKLTGRFVLLAAPTLFAILLWVGWNYLIFGNAFYFLNSQYSAGTQQQGFLLRNELPAKGHAVLAFLYYLYTVVGNVGSIIFGLAMLGAVLFLFFNRSRKYRWPIFLVLFSPFIFYTLSLYIGQSVIFIPNLTPQNFPWHLFNVRYGLSMVPFAAIFFGYLFGRSRRWWLQGAVIILLAAQTALYASGRLPILTLQDGLVGLSHQGAPDAQTWLAKNYNGGKILLDDYSRTISIIHSDLPMDNVVYVGNKPYWQEALTAPQSQVQWVVMQQNDAVWKALYDDPAAQANLYKYFAKAYTSPNILIFERNSAVAAK